MEIIENGTLSGPMDTYRDTQIIIRGLGNGDSPAFAEIRPIFETHSNPPNAAKRLLIRIIRGALSLLYDYSGLAVLRLLRYVIYTFSF